MKKKKEMRAQESRNKSLSSVPTSISKQDQHSSRLDEHSASASVRARLNEIDCCVCSAGVCLVR